MTMRNGILIGYLFVFSSPSIAMPGNLNSGSNLVSRGGYTPSLPYSSASNPASLVKRLGDQRIDIGGFSLPLLALEIGDVDNLGDRFDALEEALDDIESDDSAGGEAVTPAEADAVKSQFDDFVDELDDDAEEVLLLTPWVSAEEREVQSPTCSIEINVRSARRRGVLAPESMRFMSLVTKCW